MYVKKHYQTQLIILTILLSQITQILEGERTCTRFLIERMHEDLLRLKMKSHDDDFATHLRMLHNKVDILTNKTNQIKADCQQQFDNLENILIKLIITLQHT